MRVSSSAKERGHDNTHVLGLRAAAASNNVLDYLEHFASSQVILDDHVTRYAHLRSIFIRDQETLDENCEHCEDLAPSPLAQSPCPSTIGRDTVFF